MEKYPTNLILEFDIPDRYGSKYISGKQWFLKFTLPELLSGFANQETTMVIREKAISEINRILYIDE